MRVQCTPAVGLVALSWALVLRWGTVHATTSDSTVFSIPSSGSTGFNATSSDSTAFNDTSSDSTGVNSTTSDSTGSSSTSSVSTASCIPGLIADGSCDTSQNIDLCGYDGGDCCECTCISTDDHVCGESSDFACVDPSASCISDDDALTSSEEDGDASLTSDYTGTLSCFTGYFSDGYCDLGNNNEDCGYDGGDCCECTCVSTDSNTCGDGSNGGYACLDPSASCVDDDDITTNPEYGTYSDSGYTSTNSCETGFFSDGLCDDINNKEACGYDGGDCCACTCRSTTAFTCGESGFECQDPSASCFGSSYSDDSSFTSGSDCVEAYKADGDCDSSNNNENCEYDGGDCCQCTCVSTESFTCGDEDHGGYSCVDPAAPCVDDDSTTGYSSPYSDSGYTETNSCATGWFSDGLCDSMNNSDECGYDGGDCCQCTCVSTAVFTCGEGGYDCLDTDASCVDDDITSSGSTATCSTEYFADGDCDPSNNNEFCGYDSGDCCQCTCVSTDSFTCGEESHGGYACIDPSAACVDDDDVTVNPGDYSSTTVEFGCIPAFVSDGDCDQTNNNEDCDYDGGDCCECTCESTTFLTCGDESHGGYTCLDPRAPCVDDDDATTIPSFESYTNPDYTTANSCATGWYSDGLCDPVNNNQDCGYDGGDCCECTCQSGKLFTCGDGGYGCVDPRASCVDEDDYTFDPDEESAGYTTTNNCETGYFSDGDCDPINNKASCDYDGGDCCECTCESTVDYTCGDPDNGGFACIDPTAACVDDDDVESSSYTDPDFTTEFSCNNGWLADGLCDSINNKEDCGYDGGDCCSCTCVSGTAFDCGDGGYACLDPDASCDDDTASTGSNTYTSTDGCITGYFSDGDCDPTNNNEDCGYDGGDCCECTCISTESYTCGDDVDGGFDCLDPNGSCSDDDDDSRFHPTDDNSNENGDDIVFIPSEEHSDTDEDDIVFLPSEEYSDTDEDDIVLLPSDDNAETTGASSSCSGDRIADGACDPDNNNEECGYDGGDCCECDCVSSEEHTCGDSGDFDCIDPSSACVDAYVEAGTKTTVGVSANAYDTRPGEASGGAGCQEDGCTPALSRDGIITGNESRWSCAQKLVPDGEACKIEFTFEAPQDIMDVQVAFYKGDERSRTLEVAINGEVISNFDSYTGSTFNALGIEAAGVQTLTFTTVGLTENDWISFIEVRFLVAS